MIKPVDAAQFYKDQARAWERRHLAALAMQVGMVMLAGAVDALASQAWATVSAVMFLAAAVAWVYRLTANPDAMAQLSRTQAARIEGLSMRFAARSASARSYGTNDQFQAIAARGEAQINEAHGRTAPPSVVPYSSFTPTTSMSQSRSAPLAERISDYRRRLDSARSVLSRHADSAARRTRKWTAVGIGATVAGIGLAIWQATGGPSGYVGLASLLAAGTLAWNEGRQDANGVAGLWRAIRTLDSIALRLSEVHSDVSWAMLVDEAEDAIEASDAGLAVGQALRPLAL